MSIIADALKKAQRGGTRPVEGLPPFDLGKATQPSGAPADTQARPRPQQKAAPTVTGAPRPKPVAAGAAKPAGKPAAAGRARRMAVLFAAALVVVAGGALYVNKVYLPSIRSGGIAVAPAAVRPAPAPQETEQTPEDEAATAAADMTEISEEAPLPEPEGLEEVALEDGTESVDRPVSPQEYVSPPGERTVPPVPGRAEGERTVRPRAENAFPGPTADLGETGRGPVAPPPARGEIIPRGRDEGREVRQDIYHFNMAVYYQRRGDIQAALEEYQKVIELSPYNAEVFSNMGVLYNQMGEFDKAVAVLHRALMIDPRYSKAHNNLGLAYYQSGQNDQALEHLSRAVELDQASRDAYNNLGLVYRKMERVEQAESAFRRALAIDRGYAAAHYNLALLYDEIGRLDRAAEHYAEFLESGGGNVELNRRVRERIARIGTP